MNRGAMFTLRAVSLAVPLALALLAGCGSSGPPAGDPPLAGSTIGGPFELVDTTGRTVRWSDFDGKFRVVYFGFTYCPDVCPTDLARISGGLRAFEASAPDRAAKVQPIFISVDPERDTPPVVAEFISHFHPRLVGLTGTPEQVQTAIDNFKAYAEKGETTEGGGYMVNHSTITILFDPAGKPIAPLPTDLGPDAVAAELEKWVS